MTAIQRRLDRETNKQVRDEVKDRLGNKVTKESVNYRPKTQESIESCAECGHYLSPGSDNSSCRRIAGIVYAEDICDMFIVRKEESKEESSKGQGGSVQPLSISIEIQNRK